MAQHSDITNGAAEHADSGSVSQTPPSIAAAFLVKFDDRKGYTLAWHRAIPGLEVEGVVEFKSLPSGLHNVKEDLVYFVHDSYVGVSAFLNREDDQAARSARMLAVGVLVPLESGRMGKSWLHAQYLKQLTWTQADHLDDYSALEEYWTEHKPAQSEGEEFTCGFPREDSDDETDRQKPVGYRSNRSMSIGTIPPTVTHTLPEYHPALALPNLLHTFGPLIFPLFRAGLLRKRILLLTEAPVEQACNYVYNLSILSSIPRSAISLLPINNTADLRLQPLFNVGVSDIPLLADRKSNQGWIACTTDDVLCTKPDLFDLLVILPNSDSLRATPKKYPKLVTSSPELTKAYPKYGLRASQRDARRFSTLQAGLRVVPASQRPQGPAVEGAETASIASSVSSAASRTSVVEPQSWSRIAYTSILWWASAGDKKALLSEAERDETDQDTSLLDAFYPDDESPDDEEEESKSKEVVTVAYFHRLSTLIFSVLDNAVQHSEGSDPYKDDEDDDTQGASSTHAITQEQSETNDEQALLPDQPRSTNEDNEESGSQDNGPPIDVTQDDVAHMGLDVWSSTDRKFIEEMTTFWWGREAVVQGGRVECCGIRIV